jgi:hypothetical protein
VFHCPHDGHLPTHLGESCPQFVHTYVVFSLAIYLMYFQATKVKKLSDIIEYLPFYRKKMKKSDRLFENLLIFAALK